MAGSIIELESYDEFNKIVENSPNLVIDFHAEWCGPCKMLGKRFLTGKSHFCENCENNDYSGLFYEYG